MNNGEVFGGLFGDEGSGVGGEGCEGGMRLQLASDSVEGPQAAGRSYTCVSGLPGVMKSG